MSQCCKLCNPLSFVEEYVILNVAFRSLQISYEIIGFRYFEYAVMNDEQTSRLRESRYYIGQGGNTYNIPAITAWPHLGFCGPVHENSLFGVNILKYILPISVKS